MNNSVFKTIASLLIIIGATIGALNYFASQQDVTTIAIRLDQKILGDRIWQIKQWMYGLEDRYGGKNYSLWENKDDRDTHRRLKEQLKQLEAKYNSMFKKK